MAIAYATLYLTIESNSVYVPLKEITQQFDQEPKGELRAPIYESHLREIQETASSIARVYEPSHPSTWCVDSLLKYDQIPRQPMGLCYLRIPHAAGATLKGINMRIARNFGQRHSMETCIRHDSTVKGMDYPQRDAKSYLWTFVRDPTSRALSTIGSTLSNQLIKQTSKQAFFDTLNDTDTVFVERTLYMLSNHTNLNHGIVSEGRGGFQLQYMMQTFIPEYYVNNPKYPKRIFNRNGLVDKISATFSRYDFVGLVERFDESLVAMQLLLGLETSDILHFAVNRKEQWRKARRGSKTQCRESFDWEIDLLQKPLIHDYVTYSEEWYADNYGDYLLYHAASQSLDQTIMKIGLDYFSHELKKFRASMKRAQDECVPKFPCSSDGKPQIAEAEQDCQGEGNIGCGYQCLDSLTPTPIEGV